MTDVLLRLRRRLARHEARCDELRARIAAVNARMRQQARGAEADASSSSSSDSSSPEGRKRAKTACALEDGLAKEVAEAGEADRVAPDCEPELAVVPAPKAPDAVPKALDAVPALCDREPAAARPARLAVVKITGQCRACWYRSIGKVGGPGHSYGPECQRKKGSGRGSSR